MFDELPDVIIHQLFTQITNEKDKCNLRLVCNSFSSTKVIMKFVRGDIFFHKFIKLEFQVDPKLKFEKQQKTDKTIMLKNSENVFMYMRGLDKNHTCTLSNYMRHKKLYDTIKYEIESSSFEPYIMNMAVTFQYMDRFFVRRLQLKSLKSCAKERLKMLTYVNEFSKMNFCTH